MYTYVYKHYVLAYYYFILGINGNAIHAFAYVIHNLMWIEKNHISIDSSECVLCTVLE